jgi:hypothetical protein
MCAHQTVSFFGGDGLALCALGRVSAHPEPTVSAIDNSYNNNNENSNNERNNSGRDAVS